MGQPKQVVAILGTYRKGGIIDTAVDLMLDAAKAEGAQVHKIYLIDQQIEFCTNCRSCTQQPGTPRGQCVLNDSMNSLLDQIEQADALILASPTNFGAVTAVTKRFIERLICYAYWPWGSMIPKMRIQKNYKPAVIVASSAAPSLITRFFTPVAKTLKQATRAVGAKPVGILIIGLASMKPEQDIGNRARHKAARLAKKLLKGS